MLLSPAPLALPRAGGMDEQERCVVVMAMLQLCLGLCLPALVQGAVELRWFAQHSWQHRGAMSDRLYSWLDHHARSALRWEVAALAVSAAWQVALASA